MLQGLKVLELASVLAGPSAGMFLAELGAEVIKIENPHTRGDVTRTWKLPSENPDSDISAYFSSVNWGKKSLALNLAKPEGQEILHRLAAKADIVIASYKPGDAEKLAADFKTLKQHNSRLIYAHISGYGNHSTRTGYDAIIQAEAGFTYINGTHQSGPLKMPVALMDILAAHQVKEAILLALLQRERSGEGAYLSCSLFKSGVSSLTNQAANWLVAGHVPQRQGNEHPNIVPYGTIFKCKDGGQVVVAVGTDKQFRILCGILGKPELADDPRFATNPQRVQHRLALLEILKPAFAVFHTEELLRQLESHSIPAGKVQTMEEVFQQPASKELILETEAKSDTKGIRTIAFESPAYMPAPLAPPPHFGQHTSEILRETLNLTTTEMKLLHDVEVIWETA